MQQYLNLLKDVLENGVLSENRTGIKAIKKFSPKELEFDLRNGFPLVTTKKLHTKSIVHELLWLLKGDTNIKYLNDNGVTIWDEWADESGDLGPIYGKQWRKWGSEYDENGREVFGYDQISSLVEEIKNNPNSRRLIVSAWNVSDLDEMALPPCHTFFQCNVESEWLDLKLYQRSADLFLGVPFNITSYSLLLSMLAQVTGKKPRYFYHTFGNGHIYENHIEQVKLQLTREPKPLPKLWLNPDVKNIDNFTFADVRFLEYESWPAIKGDIAV